MTKVPSYGSVSEATETSFFTAKAGADDDAEALDRSFNADHTYYLKGGNNLTLKQKLRKYGAAAVPIVLAALIMGFFTLYLLRNLSSLYPARGDEHATIKRQPGHTTTVSAVDYHHGEDPKTSVTSSEPRNNNPFLDDNEKSVSTKKHGGNASCSAHPNCIRLIGDCCPAANGVTLDCCN